MLHQANPTAGMAVLVSGALRVGRDHIAATVNALFLASVGAALPSLILFVTGQDSLGTIATTEIVAVEVVRALCGSVGLIAAVPLTTVLAALVTTEAPPEVQTRPTGDGGHPPEAKTGLPGGPDGNRTGGPKRVGVGSAAGQEPAGLVLDCVPAVHGTHLSQAMVVLDSGGWLATKELPAAARTAAVPGCRLPR
jgi:YibE/F-like protein